MRLCFLWIVCLFSFVSSAQTKFTLNGYVRDSASGESIIGASVSINNIARTVATNQYGFYSITLDSGSYELTVSHVSYQSNSYTVHLIQNQTFDFLLPSKSADIIE